MWCVHADAGEYTHTNTSTFLGISDQDLATGQRTLTPVGRMREDAKKNEFYTYTSTHLSILQAIKNAGALQEKREKIGIKCINTHIQ